MDNVIGYFIIWAGCAVVFGTIIFVVALAIFTGDGGTPASVFYSR